MLMIVQLWSAPRRLWSMMEQAIKSKHTLLQWIAVLWPAMWWKLKKVDKYQFTTWNLVCQAKKEGNDEEMKTGEKSYWMVWPAEKDGRMSMEWSEYFWEKVMGASSVGSWTHYQPPEWSHKSFSALIIVFGNKWGGSTYPWCWWCNKSWNDIQRRFDSREVHICISRIVQNFFESRVKDVKDVPAAEKSVLLCIFAVAPAAVHNLKRFSPIST